MGPARHPNGYTPLPDNSYNNQYGTTPHPSQQSSYTPYNPSGPDQQSVPSLHSSNQQQKIMPGYGYSSGEGNTPAQLQSRDSHVILLSMI